MKVLISTSLFGVGNREILDILESAGVVVVMTGLGRTLKADEVENWAAGCDGIIAGTEPLTGEILRRLSGLKVISRVGVGLDNVDLETAGELGIAVYNTPDGPTQAVAELTIALMLDVLRGVSRADNAIRHDHWEKKMGSLLQGKKVGLIGLGRIGRRVALLAKAFGASVFAYDICPDEKWAGGEEILLMDLETLLAEADIVSLHVPCEDKKRPLIGEKEFGLMKSGVYLINVARGGLIDEEALAEALRSGRLAGAALDTFESEPYTGILRKFDNIVLSPHVGSYAVEARVLMETQAVRNLIAGLKKAKLIEGAVAE